MDAHGTQKGLLSNGTACVCVPQNHFDWEIMQERLYFETNQEALANETKWIQTQITSDSVGGGITVSFFNKIANCHGGSGEPLLVKGIDFIAVHGCHCDALATCVTLVTTLSIALSRISLSIFLFRFVPGFVRAYIVAVLIAVLAHV